MGMRPAIFRTSFLAIGVLWSALGWTQGYGTDRDGGYGGSQPYRGGMPMSLMECVGQIQEMAAEGSSQFSRLAQWIDPFLGQYDQWYTSLEQACNPPDFGDYGSDGPTCRRVLSNRRGLLQTCIRGVDEFPKCAGQMEDLAAQAANLIGELSDEAQANNLLAQVTDGVRGVTSLRYCQDLVRHLRSLNAKLNRDLRAKGGGSSGDWGSGSSPNESYGNPYLR